MNEVRYELIRNLVRIANDVKDLQERVEAILPKLAKRTKVWIYPPRVKSVNVSRYRENGENILKLEFISRDIVMVVEIDEDFYKVIHADLEPTKENIRVYHLMEKIYTSGKDVLREVLRIRLLDEPYIENSKVVETAKYSIKFNNNEIEIKLKDDVNKFANVMKSLCENLDEPWPYIHEISDMLLSNNIDIDRYSIDGIYCDNKNNIEFWSENRVISIVVENNTIKMYVDPITKFNE